jgi:hypothetical protein
VIPASEERPPNLQRDIQIGQKGIAQQRQTTIRQRTREQGEWFALSLSEYSMTYKNDAGVPSPVLFGNTEPTTLI